MHMYYSYNEAFYRAAAKNTCREPGCEKTKQDCLKLTLGLTKLIKGRQNIYTARRLH